ncbi:hypothetical protein IPJ72_00560 [Candidatus Peregrinibacteria bacterium]|nr:MAG: hypothetical protein IPJ72_00560 [Candidatus Peregrinibacteria bacterium]
MNNASNSFDNVLNQLTTSADDAIQQIDAANEELNITGETGPLIAATRKILEGVINNSAVAEVLGENPEQALNALIQNAMTQCQIEWDKKEAWKLETNGGIKAVIVPLQLSGAPEGTAARVRIEFGRNNEGNYEPRSLRLVAGNQKEALAIGANRTDEERIENAMAKGGVDELSRASINGKKINADYPFTISDGHDLEGALIRLVQMLKDLPSVEPEEIVAPDPRAELKAALQVAQADAEAAKQALAAAQLAAQASQVKLARAKEALEAFDQSAATAEASEAA